MNRGLFPTGIAWCRYSVYDALCKCVCVHKSEYESCVENLSFDCELARCVRLVTHENNHTHFILPVFSQVLDYDKQKR